MNEQEVAGMLTWLSQVDGRVEANKPTAEVWHHSLAPLGSAEAKEAILEFYRRGELQGYTPAPTPGGIRKLALGFRETQAAKQQALEAKPAQPERTFSQLQRRVESPEFRALFEQGRREGNAERAYNSTLRETGEHWRAVQARDEILGGTVAA